MKQVKIYDQYQKVLSEDGTTFLHTASAFETVEGTFNTLQEASDFVAAKYNETKGLGTTQDKIINLAQGYAELVVTLTDGTNRRFTRVIYTKDV